MYVAMADCSHLYSEWLLEKYMISFVLLGLFIATKMVWGTICVVINGPPGPLKPFVR